MNGHPPSRFLVSEEDIQHLVSLPPATAAWCAESGFRADRNLFVASDPPGRQLGSGGGSAALLAAAWRRHDPGNRFEDWLAASRKLLVHGSGESRRLPGYAAMGKPLIPMPVLPTRKGQRVDQRLLDLQLESYGRLLWFAPASYRVMITSGDVLLTYPEALPPIPDADILLVGVPAAEEEARRHGVMFCPRDNPTELAHFLQKPAIEEIRSLTTDHDVYLDTGVWMLSLRAVNILLEKSGYAFGADGNPTACDPDRYELYAEFGLALGRTPRAPDDAISRLRCEVLPLRNGRFFHFGSSRGLLDSTQAMRAAGDDASGVSDGRLVTGPGTWMDGCRLDTPPDLPGEHVLTRVPASSWLEGLDRGTCIDVVPLSSTSMCIRPYGIDDTFRGPVADPATTWFGRPVAAWFHARQIAFTAAGLAGDCDIQDAAIFPVVTGDEPAPGFLRWLTAIQPTAHSKYRSRWLDGPRRSASALLREAAPAQLLEPAARYTGDCTCLDLHHLATADQQEPIGGFDRAKDVMADVHERMYQSARARDPAASARFETEAFSRLRDLIVNRMAVAPATPTRNVPDGQVVRGRSPARLDLAGGWTDTPPYCIEFGGSVVNIAVDLDGEPPLQVAVRVTDEPNITIRSVDLDVTEIVQTYDQVQDPGQLGTGFGVAKCALALAGFSPAFHGSGGYGSLREQLDRELGGGLEVVTQAAVPKGSGLGVSSILAATTLGTLGEALGLGWESEQVIQHTSALEQLLGAGGGWQDQVGGVLPGLKWIRTEPGPAQVPAVLPLTHAMMTSASIASPWLLYYTGLTRTARDVLGEIVRGMFLNDRRRLAVLEEIGWNAAFAAHAIQRDDEAAVQEALRRSWQLNQRLDSGTNTPTIQSIIDVAGEGVAACKLLGAGGGGYMLMLADDADAAADIRQRLAASPPNPEARFTDMTVSETGFQVTRS